MKKTRSIAVFCGSYHGISDLFKEQARLLGETLALRNFRVIYGGTNIGLMDDLAQGVIEHGGHITGVTTSLFQDQNITHQGLTKLYVTKTMSGRKAKIYSLCDAAIALPGGFGTLDELFEIVTLSQLGYHKKAIGFLNINQFYDSLIQFISHMHTNGFISDESANMILSHHDIDVLLDNIIEKIDLLT